MSFCPPNFPLPYTYVQLFDSSDCLFDMDPTNLNQWQIGGNRTRDLWDTSPMFGQLSYMYEAKSVRVCGISELSLVPSIRMYSMIMIFLFVF